MLNRIKFAAKQSFFIYMFKARSFGKKGVDWSLINALREFSKNWAALLSCSRG